MGEINWLNPTREMMEGRDAGRQDRQREINDLESEVEYLNNIIEEQKENLQITIEALKKIEYEIPCGGSMGPCGKETHCCEWKETARETLEKIKEDE